MSLTLDYTTPRSLRPGDNVRYLGSWLRIMEVTATGTTDTAFRVSTLYNGSTYGSVVSVTKWLQCGERIIEIPNNQEILRAREV